MQLTLTDLKRQFLEVVGRYSFLTPKDIHRVTRVHPEVLRQARQDGLITPLGEGRSPEYDVAAVHSLLIAKGKIAA